MSQYVIRMVHSPDQCPSSNSKIRERMIQSTPEIPRLAGKLGLKMVVGPLVLAMEHESIAIIETDKPEAIHDFVVQSGLGQWNTVRITPVQTLQDAMKELEKTPPPLY